MTRRQGRRARTLLLVGDTAHAIDDDGRLHTHGALAAQLDEWFRRFDHVVIAATLLEGPPPPGFGPYAADNVTLVPLRAAGGSGLRAKVGVVAAAAGWLRTLAPLLRRADAVHLRAPCNVTLLAIPLAAALARNRYAIYAGAWEPLPGEATSFRVQRAMLRHLGGVVHVYRPPTGTTRGPLRSNISPSFTEASLADLDELAQRRQARLASCPPNEREIRLCCVGRFSENKNQANLVRAVAELRRDGIPVQLRLAGSGPTESDVRELVGNLGLDDAVDLLGPLDRTQIVELFEWADVNVLPSFTEGFPKVIVEGMALGCPAVCAATAVQRHMVSDGRGLVADTGDPRSIAAAVTRLREHDARQWVDMAARCRSFAAANTLEVFSRDVGSIIEDVWGFPPLDSVPARRRVVHVVDSLQVGGAERMVTALATAQSTCADVAVVATRGGGPMAAELPEEVALHVLGRASRWDLGGIRRFRSLVRELRPDVVHSHGWSSMTFVASALPLWGRRRHVFHDHLPVGTAAIGTATRVVGSIHPAAYVAVDPAQVDDRRLLPLRRRTTTVVLNGIDVDRYRREPHERRTPVRAIVLGNMRRQKDHPTLIRAVHRSQLPASELVVDLVGAPSDPVYVDECTRLIEQLGVSVRLAGPTDDAAGALAHYDLAVSPSRSESGPLTLIEYLAAGLPFVATDTGFVARSLPADLRRWVVPVGDVDALARKLREVVGLSDRDRAEIARAATSAATELFSIQRVVRDVDEVYQGLEATPTHPITAPTRPGGAR